MIDSGTTKPVRRLAGVFAAIGPELSQLLVVVFWSSTFVVTKAVFSQMSGLAFIFLRFVVMLLVAFGVLWARRPAAERGFAPDDLGRFIAVGLTGYTLYQFCFVAGLERTSPFSSALLVAMVPLFTVVITRLMGEPAPLQGWIGLGIAVAGAAIFLWDKRSQSGSLTGDGLSLLAAVAFAAYGILNRPLVRKYPPETLAAWSILIGGLPLLLLALPATLGQDWNRVDGATFASVIYMAVFPVYVAYQLWNWAIARRGIAAATAFSLLVPIVSGIASALLFDEAFGFWKLVGAALVLAGLVVIRLPGAIFRARTEATK